MATSKFALTAAEFEAAMQRRPHMKLQLAGALRSLMVDGRAAVDVASQLGCSKQNLYRAARQLMDVARALNSVPASHDGWVTVTVTVPPEVAKQVLALERIAREDSN